MNLGPEEKWIIEVSDEEAAKIQKVLELNNG
jgi:hypothetical protein